MSKMSEMANLQMGDDVWFYTSSETSVRGRVIDIYDYLYDVENECLFNIYRIRWRCPEGIEREASISHESIDVSKQVELI
jgi:hypothetical protein